MRICNVFDRSYLARDESGIFTTFYFWFINGNSFLILVADQGLLEVSMCATQSLYCLIPSDSTVLIALPKPSGITAE